MVLALPPPLTGGLHKGHRHRLPPGHAPLPFFPSRLNSLSVLTHWARPCGSACLTSPPPPLGFLLCRMLGLFPLRSEGLLAFTVILVFFVNRRFGDVSST